MKKQGAIIAIIFVLFIANALFSLNVERIVAWPVPFNPSRHMLTIDYAPDAVRDSPAPDRIQMTVYDINGDKVFEGTYSSLPIAWNGRNASGNTVHPGMYIVRLVVEQVSQGSLARRVIRIVVVR
jgi:hypothetical protein